MKNFWASSAFFMHLWCFALEPVMTQQVRQDQTRIFAQQLYEVTVRLATTPEVTAEKLVVCLKNHPEIRGIMARAQTAGIKKWVIVSQAHQIAKEAEGDDALATQTLVSVRNQDWRYLFDTYKEYVIAAGATVALGLFALQIKAHLLRINPSKNDTQNDPDHIPLIHTQKKKKRLRKPAITIPIATVSAGNKQDHEDTGAGVGIDLPYEVNTPEVTPLVIPQAPPLVSIALPSVTLVEALPRLSVAVAAETIVQQPKIFPDVVVEKLDPDSPLTGMNPVAVTVPHIPQEDLVSARYLGKIYEDRLPAAILEQVTIPESFQSSVIAYAHREAHTMFVPTLQEEASRDQIQARVLVWGAIADQFDLKIAKKDRSCAYWFENKRDDEPLLQGKRDEIGLGSISFQHFNRAFGDSNKQKGILRTLIGEYKIHFMPVGDLSPVLMKLFALIKNSSQLQQDIWAIKCNSQYDDAQLKSVVSGSADAKPKIVIYPATGKDAAQRVLTALCQHFKDDAGLGVAPRYNQRVTDLIYIAQGNGDDKVGLNLEYFKAPDYVHFDVDKVAQELGVSPATLNFELAIPATFTAQ